MIKEIEPRLKFIGDYLSLQKHQSFVIPEYQRSYSGAMSNVRNCKMMLNSISLLMQTLSLL